MCQYSAENGCMNDWHLIHLGHLSISGAALLTVEATAVLPDGRITWADVGLWSDETEMAMEFYAGSNPTVVRHINRHSIEPRWPQSFH
jgi:2,4-dienoyl-CoA reductase-like NADH-dependent reductase (Old Yellow Enzyme family)